MMRDACSFCWSPNMGIRLTPRCGLACFLAVCSVIDEACANLVSEEDKKKEEREEGRSSERGENEEDSREK